MNRLWPSILLGSIQKERGEQVGTDLPNINLRICHGNGCFAFEFNYKSLQTKNDSEFRRSVILAHIGVYR